MRKIIMNLIGTILLELGLIFTIGLMALVVALHYDTHPILCGVATIIGIITIILTFWYTYYVVLSFQILILHIQGYIDELIIRRMLMQYKEEVNLIKNCSKIIDELKETK